MYLAFTAEQKQLILEILQAELRKKVTVNFRDPAQDEKVIRSCIYFDGGIDMLKYVLDYDELLKQQQSQAEQAAQAVPISDPSDSSTNFG